MEGRDRAGVSAARVSPCRRALQKASQVEKPTRHTREAWTAWRTRVSEKRKGRTGHGLTLTGVLWDPRA